MSDTAHDEHEPDESGHVHGHEEHAGHDEHGVHAEGLGPIDWPAWGAGILGIGAGLAVAVCLYISTAL